jgi:hypothetical protein
MDSIEGAITGRASFSINVYYEKSAGSLNVSWTESIVGDDIESFAGYEVYIIPKPWDEFGTYELVAAPYDISSSRFFRTIGSLGLYYTKFVSIAVPLSSLNGEGEYYVRLGIIKREKEKVKDEDGNETYRYYPMNRYNYENHTFLSRISGYQPVYIY